MSEPMRPKIAYECDVLVIGSGVSGYCAAIQAGRCGCETILLEKDEVLGGNSGPSLGVGITGADRYNAFGTETGLIHELQEDAAWNDAFTHITAGTMPYNISRRNEAIVQEHLEKAGVRLLKRHYARKPIMEEGRIVGVIVEDLAAYRTVQVNVRQVVVEASGDGQIGALAGADFDMGSEGADEFGERSAPPQRMSYIQGTSLVAIAHRTDREVFFEPPPGTPPYQPRVWQDSISSFINHIHDRYFWEDTDIIFLYITESGGHLDTIVDDGQIYEILLKQLWGEWDHIKNGPHREETENWDLLWVSPKAGKRESRRFLGDYILTQTDLEEGRRFPDDIAYGGHDLDDHMPLGESANIVGHSIPPMYGIPYRTCYSRNIDNLLLAGRLISATHLAHSSSRLMRTGGAIGQAVGMAAAICCHKGCSPCEVYRGHLDELQGRLLRADATILALPVPAEGDLARGATVRATSDLRFNDQHVGRLVPMIRPAGNILWDWPPHLERVALYLRNEGDEAQPLTLDIYRVQRRRKWKTFAEFHDFSWDDLSAGAFEQIATFEAELPAAHEGWYTLTCPIEIGARDAASDDDRVIIALEKNPQVSIGFARRRWEIAEMVERSLGDTEWNRLGVMAAMQLTPPPKLGDAENTINGYHRRFSHGPTNMWISDPELGLPQSVELFWPQPQRFNKITLTFDNLTRFRHDTPWESGRRVLDHCIKSYALDIWQDGGWCEIVREEANYHRFRQHTVEPVVTDRLRLRVLGTHGNSDAASSGDIPSQCARVYQISVYDE